MEPILVEWRIGEAANFTIIMTIEELFTNMVKLQPGRPGTAYRASPVATVRPRQSRRAVPALPRPNPSPRVTPRLLVQATDYFFFGRYRSVIVPS